jgi:hypothetical protein
LSARERRGVKEYTCYSANCAAVTRETFYRDDEKFLPGHSCPLLCRGELVYLGCVPCLTQPY